MSPILRLLCFHQTGCLSVIRSAAMPSFYIGRMRANVTLLTHARVDSTNPRRHSHTPINTWQIAMICQDGVWTALEGPKLSQKSAKHVPET